MRDVRNERYAFEISKPIFLEKYFKMSSADFAERVVKGQ